MAYEIPGFTRSYEAVVDLSASYLKFVSLTGANIVGAVTAATDNVVGVLQNQPLRAGIDVYKGGENNAATVMVDGVSRAKTGAAVNGGDPLTIDAEGRVVPAGVGGRVVALAETSAAGADEVVSVLIVPLGGVSAPTA